ncbi:MAG: GAF domain-containing protein [Kiritimatiellae bacterium]|nr:GAF domain-containing protein [Kiritimatiellia bacterium]
MNTDNNTNAANAAWRLLAVQDIGTVRFALGQIIGVGLRILGADEGSLLVAEPDGKGLRFAMVSKPDGTPSCGKGAAIIGERVPMGEGVTGMAALTRDVQTASEALGTGVAFHRVSGDGAPTAVLAAPMLRGETLVGVITAVSFDRRKVFSVEQTRTYGMLANIAATVVEQQRLLERVAAKTTIKGKGGKGASADAADALESDDEAIVRMALAIARKKPQRLGALKAILAALEDFS